MTRHLNFNLLIKRDSVTKMFASDFYHESSSLKPLVALLELSVTLSFAQFA
jgi:hypothetical protein